MKYITIKVPAREKLVREVTAASARAREAAECAVYRRRWSEAAEAQQVKADGGGGDGPGAARRSALAEKLRKLVRRCFPRF